MDTLRVMRWDLLFADLEAQIAADEAAEFGAEVAERVRIEGGRVPLADRYRAHVGADLVLRLRPAGMVRGRLLGVGADVLLLRDDTGRDVLVPTAAVSTVSGLGRAAVAEASRVRAAIGLRQVMRGLARERRQVRVLTANGEVSGTVSRVGADHADVDPGLDGSAGRDPGAAASPVTVPLAAVVAVWSA